MLLFQATEQGDVVLLHVQWWAHLTSILVIGVLTWQPYITATGCWTRWCGTTAWRSGGHSSPVHWVYLPNSHMLLLQVAEQGDMGLPHGAVVATPHQHTGDVSQVCLPDSQSTRIHSQLHGAHRQKYPFLSHSDHQDQQRNCALSWLILI